MKRLFVLSAIASIGVLAGAPVAFSHVGHGDEFQAEGGVDRVEVNPQTDAMLGIQVEPIAPAEASDAVTVPVTALLEDGDRQLVFVRYENFYEPVPVVTGAMQGDRIEILEGLSIGEELVTAGSLALYAESRKTQGADVAAEEPELTEAAAPEAPTAEAAVETADATAAAATETSEVATAAAGETGVTSEASSGFPMGLVGIGAGVALVAGAAFALTRSKEA